MVKTIAKVEGMMCAHCEAHTNEAVRGAFDVKEVTSSAKKGETVIISESDIDGARLADVIAEAGYKLVSVTSEPYKKGLFGIFGK